MAKGGNTDLAKVFGGSGAAAAPVGPLSDEAEDEADVDVELDELAAEGEDEEADAPPPDFAIHALEAFPDLEEPQIDALYRAIKACHPGV